jgi:Purine nucleoside phosphorylase
MYKGAIIGGTGFETLGLEEGKREVISTPFGDAEVFLGPEVVFVSRHHKDHSLAPHLINYRANLWALKTLEVKRVIGIYAVGSITEKLAPGTVGIVSDFLDFKQDKEATFFDGKVFPLKHTDMSSVTDENLALTFFQMAEKDKLPLQSGRGTYASTKGPRLETKAEIRALRTLGADFVGMTMGSEAPLAIELGMEYLPIAFSINWAAGISASNVVFLSDEKMKELSHKITISAMDTLHAMN